MTSRQIIDRAVLRVCNQDIRLAGSWDPVSFLSGHEPELASALSTMGKSVEERDLQRVRCIDDLVHLLEREGGGSNAASDFGTASLF